MRPFAIAAVNLRRMFRDRTNLFFVFIFPMVLILLIGLAFGSGFEPQIGVVASDVGPLGEQLVERLDDVDEVTTEAYDSPGELTNAVSRGFVDAGVVIPPGYDTALRSGQVPTVDFLAGASGTGQTLRPAVQAAIRGQARLVEAARFAVAEGVTDGFEDAFEEVRRVEAFVPTVGVDLTRAGEPDPLEEEFAGLDQFDLGAGQQLLLFVFLTSLAGSSGLIQTRQLGLSRRMLATPTSSTQMLLGETLGRFAIALVQGVYIVLGSLLVFSVNWGDPTGTGAILVLFALVSAGAAMLLGALFSNDSQAGGMGVFIGLGLAAIGGCMAPLEIFPPTMRTVAHVTPHAWALEGFAELVRRDGTILDILPQLGILALFAIVLLAVATRRLHRTIVAP